MAANFFVLLIPRLGIGNKQKGRSSGNVECRITHVNYAGSGQSIVFSSQNKQR